MAAKKAQDARRQEEKNKAEIEERKQKDEAIFNRQYYQDMTDRTEVRNMLRKLREQQTAQRNANEARAAVLGTTAEQQIAEQDSLNKGYADSIADIASNASMLKDGYLKDYQGNLHDYYDSRQKMNTRMSQIEQNSSNNWATAANNAFNAAMGAAGVAAGAAGVNGAPVAKNAAVKHVDVPDNNSPSVIPEEWRIFQHDPYSSYYHNFT
ncbi:MAG: hypothetical protein IJ640_00245 [Prevotella sp.]|nr:hypothetical protein [Prevotella sp.]